MVEVGDGAELTMLSVIDGLAAKLTGVIDKGISAVTSFNPASAAEKFLPQLASRIKEKLGVSAFDQIPAGYQGPLYAEICPQTFPVVVRKGSRLSQIRFRAGGPDARPVQDIPLSVDLAGDQDGLVGYRAKRRICFP